MSIVECSLERGRGMTKQRPALRTEDTEDMGSSVTEAINIYQPLIHRPQQYCSIHYHNGMEGKIRMWGMSVIY